MLFLIIAMLVILCIIIFIMYRIFYKGKFYKRGFFAGFGVLNDYYPASCLYEERAPFFYTETLQEVLNMALHSEKLVSIRQGIKYEMCFTKMKYKEERKFKERIIEFIEIGYDNNLLDEK